MSETRPSGIPIISGPDIPVSQEVAEIDNRGRLKLLARWTQRVAWLAAAPPDFEALMVFVEPGRLSIQALEPNTKLIEDRIRELAQTGEAADLEAIRLILDRYGRLKFADKRRPHLGDPALLHLGLARGVKSSAYVAVFPDRIDVMSAAYRDARHVDGHDALDGLP